MGQKLKNCEKEKSITGIVVFTRLFVECVAATGNLRTKDSWAVTQATQYYNAME